MMDLAATFGAAEFQKLSCATDDQMADIETYLALLVDWNEQMNLVGPSALASFWLRHAWDSAQLLALAPAAKVWADVGAGAGFPGLIIAILLKSRQDSHVHLVESMTKRCRFLDAVIERLGLPATVHNGRGEDMKMSGIDVVTARACAPMVKLLGYCQPLMRRGATGLFLKGQAVSAELDAARKQWMFKDTIFPSRSDASGAIVRIEDLAHV